MSFALQIRVLKYALALLRRGWCQKHSAEDDTGQEVHATDPDACRWCAGGALDRAIADISEARETDYLELAANVVREAQMEHERIMGRPIRLRNRRAWTLPVWNDQATRDWVLNWFQVAIDKLEAIPG